MVTCNNCGQPNADGTHICRYCGAALSPTRQAAEYRPPQTAWGGEPAAGAMPVQPYAPQPQMQHAFRCPFCGSAYPPQVGQRISSDGWLVFGLLLFFCAPLFWIGLLMKEEYRVCATCGSKFG
jgi:hypothetical protein